MLYEVEIHTEVGDWLRKLSETHFARVDALVGRLAENPHTPGIETREINEGVREIRFRLNGDAWRLTYWVTGQRVVLLTVIRKTQDQQQRDIERAWREKRTCEKEHGPATTDFRR